VNSETFLTALRGGLAGLPPEDVEDIIADYAAHFVEARATGRAEGEVAAALGDPARLARELRAETGLRRFETHRSLGNLLGAMLALAGLAAVDIFFLLPLLLGGAVIALVVGVGLLVAGIVGIRIVFGVLFLAHGGAMVGVVARLLIGVGLIACLIGGGSALLLGLAAEVSMLGRYVRLHYRLLEPGRAGASADDETNGPSPGR
jgi:uncharacterized membrane protein